MADLLKFSILCSCLWWAFVARKKGYWFVSIAALPVLAYLLWGALQQ